MTIKSPHRSILASLAASRSGRKPTSILPPSRGGTGSRLKKPKTRLMIIPWYSQSRQRSRKEEVCSGESSSPSAYRAIGQSRATMAKLVRGPARATRAIPRRGLRKLRGLTGTGFAPPKTKGDPRSSRVAGIRIVMKRSM